MLCFSSAVEALRIANRMSGRALYEWTLVGEGGAEAWCSAGIGFKLDGDLEEVTRDDTVLVCGGHRRGRGDDQARDQLAQARGAQGRDHGRAVHRGLHAGQGRAAGRQARDDPLGEPGQFRRGIRGRDADQVGLRHRRQPDHDGRRHGIHRPDAQDHRRRSWRGPRQSRRRSVDLYLDPHRPGHATAVDPHADRCAPPQARSGHPDDGAEHRGPDQPRAAGQGSVDVDPPAGTPVPAVSQPQPPSAITWSCGWPRRAIS